MTQLFEYGAVQLAELVARREVSIREVIAARIDEQNPYLGAVTLRPEL